ncbi:MAG: 4-hydroxybenzoate octaprenyltransferase [Pseudomonadota bacterium]
MTAETGKPVTPDVIVPDAASDNWVDTYAPDGAKPYLRLMRADRPIGTWLLLFPCLWSQALAHLSVGEASFNVWFAILFAIGAFVMRGAGCTWNDIVDRDYDSQVERTAHRPIPSGQVTVLAALVFAVVLSLIGFLVLIQFNWFTILVGIGSLAVVAAYPFAKRFTYWPQAVLGLAFNWGALVGWTAVTGSLSLTPLVFYIGCLMWTVAYDTIYAHQDADDDAMIGLKSTAIKFGQYSQPAVMALYCAALILWAIALAMAGVVGPAYLALAVAAGHFVWQAMTLDTSSAENCLMRFKSNQWVGWILFVGLLAEIVVIGL